MYDNKSNPCNQCGKKDCDKYYIDDIKENICWDCYWQAIKDK